MKIWVFAVVASSFCFILFDFFESDLVFVTFVFVTPNFPEEIYFVFML